MKCIPPIIVTDAILTSSTVAEPVAPAAVWVSGTTYTVGTVRSVAGTVFHEYSRIAMATVALWVSGTTYIIGDLRKSVTNGFEYKRITAGAGSTDPASDPTNWTDLRTISPELNPEQWLDLGPYERVWISGTSYLSADEVIRTGIHRKFTRISAGAGTVVPELDPLNWKDTGATRKMAMFDLKSSQQTVAPGPLVTVIALPSRIDAIGITGVYGGTVRLQQTVGATVYYDKTINCLLRNTLTWTDYFFGAFRYRPALVAFDIPPVSGATLTITITGATVKCGRVFLGRAVDMGMATEDAESDVLNFSTTTRDIDGTATLVPRPTVPKGNLTLRATSDMVNKLRDLRVDTNAKVALWSALDDQIGSNWFDAFLIPGIWKVFTINAKRYPSANVSLQLEEI